MIKLIISLKNIVVSYFGLSKERFYFLISSCNCRKNNHRLILNKKNGPTVNKNLDDHIEIYQLLFYYHFVFLIAVS